MHPNDFLVLLFIGGIIVAVCNGWALTAVSFFAAMLVTVLIHPSMGVAVIFLFLLISMATGLK
jgi:hypothetical protein